MNSEIHPPALRNVGIVAHVDAGKTTLTEHMLYESGRIRSLGRVDSGTAQTDWLEVEKQRGISVRAATTELEWKHCRINLIDTPGHVDFSSEVERSLRALDGAILMISAAEGVQAHTETLWQALRALNLPTLIFINKMDRVGADAERVIQEIRDVLTDCAVPVQRPLGQEDGFCGTSSIWGSGNEHRCAGLDAVAEKLAETDEALLDAYVNGEPLPGEYLKERLIYWTRGGRVFPVLFGAAGKGIGIGGLLDAVVEFLPPPEGTEEDELSGIVFKLERDKSMGRVAYVRLYGGCIRNRDAVRNATLDTLEKITQIRKIHAGQHEDLGELKAGDIAAVCGMSRVRVGDVLGSAHRVPPEHKLAVPLLTVQAHPARDTDYARLTAALQELADEDPLLDLQWLPTERELHLKITGPIQLEILTQLLQDRFGLQAAFGSPGVIYKETPSRSGYGFVAYTMPKPCWAILKFLIEPGLRGSGLSYASVVKPERLLSGYQNEVERRVPEALQQGLSGWEVTDLKVTLVEGEHHVWHTHPLDFAVATPMGIMQGLAETGTKLLEPYLRFRLSAQEELGGKLLNELVLMRGEFDSPVIRGGRFHVDGSVPVATSMTFPVKLSSLTGGRGTFTTKFDGYRECPEGIEAVRTRRGVNPLDTSKYILSVRNALKA
ncbi:TetM/TetW/TetO/TetS family tetracycline resistance ribosomal protection protein [Paenibacillus filicis]|uniref:TetM/TetW/TetO/TetS family tetracycline resistance ribosomal protection protein n=1 Tax=Paenibacillus gyeongsangnamensis TaxID=3388067 RepID=A0ABT4Q897_9BACL|nr:TetM/TetW/TetO/TetS family tetracycline resistance ribosomal protection protein [Paenibacillus filicis]MCZ8513101.1 TetM/TetW/TetO/TetS family tetracycline resistance ribosomal protection protein [Paenibacillus filicis]